MIVTSISLFQQKQGVQNFLAGSGSGMRLTFHFIMIDLNKGLPWWLRVEESSLVMQETWVQSLVRKIPGKRNGNPLQFSFLGNPTDRGVWQATPLGGKEFDTPAIKQQQQPKQDISSQSLNSITMQHCAISFTRYGQRFQLAPICNPPSVNATGSHHPAL